MWTRDFPNKKHNCSPRRSGNEIFCFSQNSNVGVTWTAVSEWHELKCVRHFNGNEWEDNKYGDMLRTKQEETAVYMKATSVIRLKKTILDNRYLHQDCNQTVPKYTAHASLLEYSGRNLWDAEAKTYSVISGFHRGANEFFAPLGCKRSVYW